MSQDLFSAAGNVVPIDAQNQQLPTASPEPPVEVHRDFVMMIRAGLQTLNARVLLLLALLFGGGIWCWTVMDPTPWRFIAASGFSVGVLWPIALLYAKKG